jgi:HD domain
VTFPTRGDGASGDVADQARQLAARTRPDLGRLADARVPDSAAAAEAERLARAESSAMLYGHALRSYFYAALLAARNGIDYDQELLYVGCVLHDIGLTPRFADPVRPFEHVSADTCAELVERHGWALPRRYRLHRAVVLHMAPTLPPAEDTEVLLLEAGVACDVTGARSREVSGRAIDELLARYPRAGFKREFTQLLRSEAARKPLSHAALLLQQGLEERIADAPFAG